MYCIKKGKITVVFFSLNRGECITCIHSMVAAILQFFFRQVMGYGCFVCILSIFNNAIHSRVDCNQFIWLQCLGLQTY